jgi:hypothetical protein
MGSIYETIPELQARTKRASRHSELFKNVLCFDRSDIEAINFAIMEVDLTNGKMRDDRPMPTDEKQKPHIAQMNESDADWINRLLEYKNDIGVKLQDTISLTEYQQSWFEFILCKSDTKPRIPEPKERALRHVDELASVPF